MEPISTVPDTSDWDVTPGSNALGVISQQKYLTARNSGGATAQKTKSVASALHGVMVRALRGKSPISFALCLKVYYLLTQFHRFDVLCAWIHVFCCRVQAPLFRIFFQFQQWPRRSNLVLSLCADETQGVLPSLLGWGGGVRFAIKPLFCRGSSLH